MKKKYYFVAVLILALFLSVVNPVSAFSDVSEHWAKQDIMELLEKGGITGYEDGSFRPNAEITRAEVVTMLNRLMKWQEESKTAFSDVKEEDWFAKEVATAVAKGYVKGYSDGNFYPNKAVTRAEIAVMVARAYGLEAKAELHSQFADSDKIADWAKPSINALLGEELMKGYPDNTYRPENKVTRAEVATLFHRVSKKEMATVKTVLIEKKDTVVAGKIVTGNVVVSEKLGEGNATLKDMTVQGDLIILGGGANSIHLENAKVLGKTILEKRAVRVVLHKGSALAKVEIKEKAYDAKIVLEETAKIKELVANTKASLNGKGTVEVLRGQKDQVQVEATLQVKNSQLSNKVANPSGPSSFAPQRPDSPSVPNGPSGPSIKVRTIQLQHDGAGPDITADSGTVTITVTYEPKDATNQRVRWTIKKGSTKVKSIAEDHTKIVLQGLDNGDYEVVATVEDDNGVVGELKGNVSGQVVGIAENSVSGIAAGDKKITGLEPEKAYILKNADGYYSVDGQGKASTKAYPTEAEAKLFVYPLQPDKNEITGLENSRTYQVIELNADDLFEPRFRKYLSLQANDLNKENAEFYKDMHDSLNLEITDEIRKLNGQPEKSVWEERKRELEAKFNELNARVSGLIAEIEESKNLYETNKDVFTGKHALDVVKQKLQEVQKAYAGLPSYLKSTHPDFEENVRLVEAEVTLYESLQSLSVTLDDMGVATFSKRIAVPLEVKLVKEPSDAKATRTLRPSASQLNFLDAMRKEAGSYHVEVITPNFERIESAGLSIKSNTKQVQYLESLGSLNLSGPNFNKTSQNDKIEFDAVNKEIRWDAIANAEYYDIFGTITLSTVENYMGWLYLQEKIQEADIKNYNIARSYERLAEAPSGKKKWPLVIDGTHKNGRVFVAANLPNKAGSKNNRISLKEFVGTTRNSAKGMNDFIGADDDVTVDIYIVPRALSGLYITDNSKYTGEQGTLKTIFIDGLKFNDYLEKFGIE